MRISYILEPENKTSRTRLAATLAALLIAAPLALAQGLSEQTGSKVQTFSSPIITTEGTRVTSKYGLRTNPFTKKKSWHAGIDLAGLPKGTPLAAPANGTIVYAGTKLAHDGTDTGYGQLVDMRLDKSGHVIRYAQLDAIKVSVGEKVSAGDIIGLLGSSGRSTAPHLHLEYHIDGKGHNPQEIEGLILFEE